MDLAKELRHIPNFPKAGIDFIDITTVLQNAQLFRAAIDQMSEIAAGIDFELIVGTESRGFILGAPMAYAMNRGFIPVRKKGKLPWKTVQEEYELEYGKDTMEMHIDAVKPGARVLVVDDLLATGGTALANCRLIEQCGGVVAGVLFFIEIEDLGGRKKLADYPVYSLVSVQENIP